MNSDILAANEGDYPRLLQIWQAAVKETHDFLEQKDFEFFSSKIVSSYFPQVKIYKYMLNGQIVGFIGVSDDKLEMLFIDPKFFGQGIGCTLVDFCINKLSIYQVDVNEQNTKAVQFYLKRGFCVLSRQEVDGTGKRYPILKMKFKKM
ncbi:GNAT family N-acetyltransferase [Cysteiniphilum sp. 6C5]|uniref:GNAT family N-acetyltransferase n=1 Tax=unclassified Cysteiniphilum TaxID=2610889 RepID=UPI003F87A3A0